MDIYNEIELYLNKKLEETQEIIAKEIYIITGINDEFIYKKINILNPTYIVDKDILKLVLDIDLDKLPLEDIKLIEYFLNAMEDKDKLYISKKDNSKRFIVKTKENEVISISYEQNIYGGSFSNDINYIAHILMTFGARLENGIMYLSTSNIKIKNIEKVYSLMLTNLAIIIVSNLHKNNIYIFDNKYTSQTPECINSSLESYFKDFYEKFQDIIPLFLTNLNEFINIVGKDNFEEFIINVSEDNLENMDEILDKMYIHKIGYQNETYINMDLIMKSLKKYKEKEK